MLLDLHLFFIWVVIALVLYADEQGLLWVRGTRETLPGTKLEWLHAVVGIGLAGLILTGGLLFLRAPALYLSQFAFIVKLLFVAALIINSFFISHFSELATERSWRSLASHERRPLLISGAISVVGWGGAIICGLLLLH